MYSCFALVLALLIQAPPANPPAAPPTDALAFLRKVTQRYADAKSYHIEATLERTNRNTLLRNWQKYLLTAIVATGGRYRYEGQSGYGSAVFVSDGTKQWIYHPDVHEYTESVVPAGKPAEHGVYRQEEYAVMEAQRLINGIRTLAMPLKSAGFLPDGKIRLNGQSIDCRVVHFTNADFTERGNQKLDETVWIDKSRNVIVKTVSHSESFTIIPDENFQIPTEMEEATVYTVVKLDPPEPESSFNFSPPPDTKPVASFPTAAFGVPYPASEFVGKLAPDIHLKLDGKVIPLSSYRGKPVFIDFWATWCGPCVAAMPELKKLYAETRAKGLVWIGIDEDKNPTKVNTFLKEKDIPWPDYNDADGSLGKAFGPHGLPLEVLIDASGEVTFWEMGHDDGNLRAAIAKLGPEFSSVAADSRAETQKR
jgi:thiol-disulfide isomerase/thioredoxin